MAHLWSLYLISDSNRFTFSCFLGINKVSNFHYDSIHSLNFLSNYLEINANYVNHRILDQAIAEVFQSFGKRQYSLLDLSTGMLPLLFLGRMWYVC